MIFAGMVKRGFKNLADPVTVGVCSNILAAVYMLTAIYSINADVPSRSMTNQALTAVLGVGVAMLVYFWILYIKSVLKRWKEDGFTLSLKLDVDEELNWDNDIDEYITLREGTGVYMSDSMVEKVLDEYEKNNKKLDHSQRIFYREKLKDIVLIERNKCVR